ncbi:7870_t:CDS:2, partial [Racocetra fulgida]
RFIQETQLTSTSPKGVFEWIPYSELSSLKLINDGIAKYYSAYWSSGPRILWDETTQEYFRSKTNTLISVSEYAEQGTLLEYLRLNCNLDLAPKGAPKSYVVLMNQCLNNDPKLRPSIMQIVNTFGEWYLEVERNIDTPIVTEFRIADEFRQASSTKLNKYLKTDSDVIALVNEDISSGSLLSTIHELGVDIIDFNQFTDQKSIGVGGFGSVEKALWRRTNKYIALKKIKNISAINYNEHKAFIHELKIHFRLNLIDRIVRMFGVTQCKFKLL